MSTDVAKITDEVYMEVVVGGEDPGNPQRTLDNASLSKDFMPVAWAAAYSKSKTYTSYSKVALCSVFHKQNSWLSIFYIKGAFSDVTCFLDQNILSHTANISSLSASCLSPEHTVKKSVITDILNYFLLLSPAHNFYVLSLYHPPKKDLFSIPPNTFKLAYVSPPYTSA